jgi:hypothetical protein
VNPLTMLRAHQYDAELDAAVWVDDHNLLRHIAGFLAHHRVLRTVVLVVAAPLLAIPAAIWAARETGRVLDRAHEVAGKGTKPCRPCVTAEADAFAAEDTVTYTDVCNAWDLSDGGLL